MASLASLFSVSSRASQRGVSLAEGAIAFTIAAAVLGGVLIGGSELVAISRQNVMLGNIKDISKAVMDFESKYQGIPGDIPSVSDLTTGAQIAGGNGDGVLDTNEKKLFWRHLQATKFLPGSFDPNSNKPGIESPYKDAYYEPFTDGDTVGFQVINVSGLGVMSPRDLSKFDTKNDDGSGKGNIQGIDAPGVPAGSCINADGSYNTQSTGPVCIVKITPTPTTPTPDATATACPSVTETRVSPTQSCPVGTQGNVLEICSGSPAVWTSYSNSCAPIQCSGGKIHGDTRTLNCPAGYQTGGSITETCTSGVWKTTANTCAVDLAVTCDLANSTRFLACPNGKTGQIFQTCTSGKWVYTSGSCQDIPVSCGNLGDTRTSSTNSCPTSYSGSVTEICTVDGWKVTASYCTPPASVGSCSVAEEGQKRSDSVCPIAQTGSRTLVCRNLNWQVQSTTCQPITCEGHPIGTLIPAADQSCPQGQQGIVMKFCDSNATWKLRTENCTQSCDGAMDHAAGATWRSALNDETISGTCDAPNVGNPIPTRTCNKGTWSDPAGACVDPSTLQCPQNTAGKALWPATTAPTPGNPAKQVTVGAALGNASCLQNYTGSPTRLCNFGGTWSNPIGSCTAITCPAITTANALTGNATWLSTDVLGTGPGSGTAAGTCDAARGYTGTPTRSCTNQSNSGVWGSVSSPCVKTTCDAFTDSDGYFWPTTPVGSTPTNNCKPGYTGGPLARACLAGGTYSTTTTGTCTVQACPPATEGGTTWPATTPPVNGSKTEPGSCSPGFTAPDPVASRTCNFGGSWSDIGSGYSCTPITCPQVTEGGATWSRVTPHPGTVVLVIGNCLPGYVPTQVCTLAMPPVCSDQLVSRECDGTTGAWREAYKGCQSGACSATNDNNAQWPASNHNDTVTGTCNAGYVGTPSRTCSRGRYGTVSNACTPAPCPEIQGRLPYVPLGCNDNSGCAYWPPSSSGSTVSGSCVDGYYGSVTRSCLNGTWSAISGECTGGGVGGGSGK